MTLGQAPRIVGSKLPHRKTSRSSKPIATFKVNQSKKNWAPRSGSIVVGDRLILTPCVWFGTGPDDSPRIWEHLIGPNVIASAVELGRAFLDGGDTPLRAERWMEIKQQAPLLMDSGGFRFLSDAEFRLSPQQVMRGYKAIQPDFGVVLDFPLEPSHSDWANHRRWIRTLRNTKWMLRNDGVVNLVPVLHGYTGEELMAACEEVASLAQPAMVGLGSIVPLLKRGLLRKSLQDEWGSVQAYIRFAIRTLREWFPKSAVHVFGVGSVATMRQVISAGADSMDSSSWRMKAAHGAIIVPGGYDRFVTPGPGRAGIGGFDQTQLRTCHCPVCRGRGPSAQLSQLDNAKGRTFANRAIHNAWVLSMEVETIRGLLQYGALKHSHYGSFD